ncbi:MAG: bleomycin resistance protein [bacterium]|nr:bleomycin resistance protein [bacterium]
MTIRGPLDHMDLSIRDPERSIPFYETFFTSLGYERLRIEHPGFAGERPERAAWATRMPGGAWFGIEVRPASGESRGQLHDRYAPGLHHMAFHADSRECVDGVFQAMHEMGATILDPPVDYSGQAGYSEGYYAVFFADPDGMKLEVVYAPRTNPA